MAELDPAGLDLPTLAALAGAAANDHVLRRLRDEGFAGVRVSYGYVIQNLIGEQPTLGELATRLGVSQQAASKSVAEMEDLGLVARTADPADSRVRRVGLTDHGRALLSAARTARAELERAVAVNADDLAAAKRTLVGLLEQTGELGTVSRRRVRPTAG